MTTGQRIEIPLSKSNIILMLIGALVFVAVGLWFIIAPPKIENSYWGNPTKVAIVGYASIIFFGVCAAALTRKLPDSKPGLTIDDIGLTDNSSGLAAGHILWTDIENISVLEIHKQRLIMLEVKNPQDYIGRQKSFLKRKGMEFNYKMYRTPLSITANGLKIPFHELLALVTQKFQDTRTNSQLRSGAIKADE
jgi:hypothetical protein